ncbi:MAG: CoA ester lyase [Candidatus Tectomicrobia bacterium]|nr:CoA ester lyase [Candidatus Tectomicrobia bacterium]
MEPLRSLLFVPGHQDRLLQKAPERGADGLLYDLEDSVPAAEKRAAREKVGDLLRNPQGPPRYVRVNGFVSEGGEPWVQADLEAVVRVGLSGVVLPKPESAEEIRVLAAELQRLESRAGIAAGKVEIIPFIESARGVLSAHAILTASPRVASVCFGGAEDGDLVRDLGCRWSPEGTELLYARSKVLLEARAAGIEHPLDGVFLGLDDEEGLLRDAESARRLGYRGKTVIHPRQIGPVHRVFSPSEEEVAYYRDMISAFEAAEARGVGAISFRGKMIDLAMVKKARGVLARAKSLESGESR